MGEHELSTRMYTSLAEIVNGWTKNMVTAGADTLPAGALPRLLLPVLLLVVPLMHCAAGHAGRIAVCARCEERGAVAAVCSVMLLAWWSIIDVRAFRQSPLYAFTLPLGAVIVLVIIARATVRGRGVEWKRRKYQAG